MAPNNYCRSYPYGGLQNEQKDMNYTPISIYRLKIKYIMDNPEKVMDLIIGEIVVVLLLSIWIML